MRDDEPCDGGSYLSPVRTGSGPEYGEVSSSSSARSSIREDDDGEYAQYNTAYRLDQYYMLLLT